MAIPPLREAPEEARDQIPRRLEQLTTQPASTRRSCRSASASCCDPCHLPSYSTTTRYSGHERSAMAKRPSSNRISLFSDGSGSPDCSISRRTNVSGRDQDPTRMRGKASRARRTPGCPDAAPTASWRAASELSGGVLSVPVTRRSATATRSGIERIRPSAIQTASGASTASPSTRWRSPLPRSVPTTPGRRIAR